MLTELVQEGNHTVDMFDTRDVKRQSNLMAAMDHINSAMGRRTAVLCGGWRCPAVGRSIILEIAGVFHRTGTASSQAS